MRPLDRAAHRVRLGTVHACRVALSAVLLAACSTEDPAQPTPPGLGTTQPPLGGAPPASLAGATSTIGGQAAPPTAGATPGPIAGGSSALGGNGAAGMTTTAGSDALPAGGTTGAMPPGSPDWTMMGYDHGSTYFNRAETKLTKENAASLSELWTADMGGNVYGAPLQIGDTLYASGPSSVRAYAVATGMMQWSASVGSTGSLSFADGTLYVNNLRSEVVAIDAESGQVKWMKQADTQRADGSSSALVAGDVVLVGGSNGGIELAGGTFRGFMSALDRMTGDIAWTTYTVPTGAQGASIWSSPSADIAANRAYGSTGNNFGMPATDTSDAIIAFDLGTGEIVWKNQREEGDTFRGFGSGEPDFDFGANPVLYETMVDGVMTQLVAAGAKSGASHAVRRDDGMLVWSRPLCMGQADGTRGIFVNTSWSGKYILTACNEGGPATLYGLDGATGDVAWMRTLPAQVWGRISVANGVGFVGNGTNLEVFDTDTGASLKTIPSKGGTVAGTVTISNGRVAFGEGLSWSTGRRGSTLTVLAVP